MANRLKAGDVMRLVRACEARGYRSGARKFGWPRTTTQVSQGRTRHPDDLKQAERAGFARVRFGQPEWRDLPAQYHASQPLTGGANIAPSLPPAASFQFEPAAPFARLDTNGLKR